MIQGVMIKQLTTHVDERGFFREVVRRTDEILSEGFGQLSLSHMYQGVIKAWHIHRKQVDWWYLANGVIKVALYDTRRDSSTYRELMEVMLGDNQPAQLLKIPTGVAHGCKCISGPADLFYITSDVYNPQDEGRIPYNDPEINYDWIKGPEIK